MYSTYAVFDSLLLSSRGAQYALEVYFLLSEVVIANT